METNRTVIDKIKYLYKRLYKAELFSSSLTVHMNEHDDFYEYSRQHQPAFKIAMMELGCLYKTNVEYKAKQWLELVEYTIVFLDGK